MCYVNEEVQTNLNTENINIVGKLAHRLMIIMK